MFPNPRPVNACRCAFLCLRRGVSASTVTIRAARPFSLPTQRCFYLKRHHPEKARLFSAYAEVFPGGGTRSKAEETFLCLRRGVSDLDDFVRQLVVLFSAYAEVFLDSGSGAAENAAFLCLRRGVSQARIQRQLTPQLFSAYAEVFLRFQFSSVGSLAFLCLRRGVSEPDRSLHDDADFSLPTQRCFPPEKGKGAALDLFSAYAELFPVVSDALAALAAFLCLRRGVSIPARPFLVPGVTFLCLRRGVSGRECRRSYHRHFSLPTQRCFRFEIRNIEIQSLFSAYAEVFLSSARWTTPCLTFLCLRRGVSEKGA